MNKHIKSSGFNLESKNYIGSFRGSTKHFNKFQFEYAEGREYNNMWSIRDVS